MMRKPSASPGSYSGTMWGWARLAAISISRTNRSGSRAAAKSGPVLRTALCRG